MARQKKPPSRDGQGEEVVLKDMLYAIEHRIVPKPSGGNLMKYAGREIGKPRGSKSTVLKAQEIGELNGWCHKPSGGQWQYTDAHTKEDRRREQD